VSTYRVADFPAMVSLDGMNWYERGSLMGRFIKGISWLSWVAEGCRLYTVTEVDAENGVVTISVPVEP